MLLSSLIIALVSPALATALPTPTPAAEQGYSFDPALALASHSSEIARLATVVNAVRCPDQLDSGPVARSEPGDDDELDVAWTITRDLSWQTYTLAFAGSSSEDLLELLASGSPDDLTPLPKTYLRGDQEGQLSIYTPYVPYLPVIDQATDALMRIVEIDQSNSTPSLLSQILSTLLFRRRSQATRPRIEVTGHGLGSATGLLASLRLSTQDPDLPIRATLFSLPRVGDSHFANALDERLSLSRETLSIRRVSSGRDPVPSLPPPHFGLQHPSKTQHLHLGQQGQQDASKLGHSSIEDSYGPYSGVFVDLDC